MPKKSKPSKSDFIRSQPATTPAAAVAQRAKERGIEIDAGLVYKVRGRARAKASSKTKKKTTGSATKREPMSKAAFVRSLPPATPAKEVVSRAAARGMKMSANYVYNVRSAPRIAPGRTRTATAARATRPSAGSGSSTGLRARILAAAASFADGVLAAIRRATLDELIASRK